MGNASEPMDGLFVSSAAMDIFRKKRDADGRSIFGGYIDNIAKAGLFIKMQMQGKLTREILGNINWSEWDKVPEKYQTDEFLDTMQHLYRENFSYSAPNTCKRREVQLAMSFFHCMTADDAERPYTPKAVPDMFAELNIGPVLSIEEIFAKEHELNALMTKYRERPNAQAL